MTTRIAHFELPEMWMELRDTAVLAALMDKQGKSARHMARAAGYKSHTYLQRVLRGEVKPNFDLEPAARIAYDLGVPFELLFRTRVSADGGQSERKIPA